MIKECATANKILVMIKECATSNKVIQKVMQWF